MNNNGYSTVTLTLDNDKECECEIIRIFEAGERDYIALLPVETIDDEESQVYIYRYEEHNGEPSLSNIETDEEYEIVSEAFDEELDAMEYEELYGEDDIEE